MERFYELRNTLSLPNLLLHDGYTGLRLLRLKSEFIEGPPVVHTNSFKFGKILLMLRKTIEACIHDIHCISRLFHM